MSISKRPTTLVYAMVEMNLPNFVVPVTEQWLPLLQTYTATHGVLSFFGPLCLTLHLCARHFLNASIASDAFDSTYQTHETIDGLQSTKNCKIYPNQLHQTEHHAFHHVFPACSPRVYHVFTTCSSRVYHVFTTCSPLVHHVFTPCSPRVHHVFTTCSPRVHHVFTTCSPRVHHVFTMCLPCVHHVYTTCSPRVHHVFSTCRLVR